MDSAFLDTDILNELLKRKNLQVVRHATAYLEQHSQFAFSAITRYELLRGLKEKSATRQLAQFETFCQRSIILSVDDAVLVRAAELWAFARRRGFPFHDADLIIAATALETKRVLISGNTAHFIWVPELRLANWRDI